MDRHGPQRLRLLGLGTGCCGKARLWVMGPVKNQLGKVHFSKPSPVSIVGD